MSIFTDRLALVTGGASGIGRALGGALRARGARVALADRAGERVRAAAAEIGAEAIELDVADRAAFEAAVATLTDGAGAGGLDYLFNNAGVAIVGDAEAMPATAWKQVLDVNLHGVVHGVLAAYPRMVRRGRGHICNVACIAGLTPVPLATAYSASKHAIVGLSTSLRAEAADRGVQVSVVCPGAVATDLFHHGETIGLDRQALADAWPFGRLLSPERCAEQILRGVERNRAVITVPAYARAIWWFYRLTPGLALRLGVRFTRAVRERLSSRS